MLPTLAAALLSLLQVSAPARGPEGGTDRQHLTGVVRGLDGAPLAGARVRLLSNRVPGRPDLPGNDAVEAVSDAEGRYRVGLLPDRSYSLWALAEGEGGRYASSSIEGGVMGPDRHDVWLRHVTHRTELRIEGYEGEGLRYELELGRGDVERIPSPAPEHGVLLLPALPEGQCGLRILDAAGRVVREQRLYTLGDGP
ncbi:MAG: carboxypeptidase-like regulatory domain-containing protein, partial [Planctomycetota bacterium]